MFRYCFLHIRSTFGAHLLAHSKLLLQEIFALILCDKFIHFAVLGQVLNDAGSDINFKCKSRAAFCLPNLLMRMSSVHRNAENSTAFELVNMRITSNEF